MPILQCLRVCGLLYAQNANCMTTPEIPFSHWQPLSVRDLTQLFAGAPFMWGLAGGYAVEQFVGKRVRDHGDIDVIVYRDQQLEAQRWLSNWHLYVADPPGSLRPWAESEFLPYESAAVTATLKTTLLTYPWVLVFNLLLTRLRVTAVRISCCQ